MLTFANVWGAGVRGLYVSGFIRTQNPTKAVQKYAEKWEKVLKKTNWLARMCWIMRSLRAGAREAGTSTAAGG